MKDEYKNRELSNELAELRLKVVELEKLEARHRMAEKLLRENEQKYHNLFDNAIDAIITIDLQDSVTSWNRGAEKLFGWTRHEVLGKKLPELIIPPDLKNERDRIIPDALAGKEITGIETCRIRKDGSRVDVSLTFSPIKDANQNVIGLSGIIRDITERKQIEEKIKKLNEELRQKVIETQSVNKELEAFSYSVSHDLRAPLRSIDGFSQALLEDYAEKLDLQGKDYLQRVRAASQRMAQLIDDMLMLSRVTRHEMKRSEVDLSALANTISAELAKTQPQRHVDFIIAPGLVVNGDVELLRAMLENLLGNAWKFTSKHQSARIEFGVTQHDGKPVYFVKDDGVGFEMTYADKLFQAFQRLHSSAEFPGTGIGLATVKRIIHMHGGSIRAESETGKGATFYFDL